MSNKVRSFLNSLRAKIALVSILISAGCSLILFQNCTSPKAESTKVTAPSTSRSSQAADAPGDCTFNGEVIDDGGTVTAFLSSTSQNGTCASQTRFCIGGILTGTYAFPTCTVQTTEPCTFNGQQVAHGATVTAYLNTSAPFGGSCASEQRTCNNGVLSGSYQNGGCEVGQPAACQFNGATVAHGASVTAHLNSSVPFGSQCTSEQRTCNNGVLGGSYDNPSCAVGSPSACSFNGTSVAHGGSVLSYKNSTVPFGTKCVSETRACTDGVLSGTFTYASCVPNAPKACLFNGKTVPHGGRVTGYQRGLNTSKVACKKQTRVCSNGTLSGSYAYASCTTKGACLFKGLTVPVGSFKYAYAAPSVVAPKACVRQKRVCQASGFKMTGSSNYLTCAAQ